MNIVNSTVAMYPYFAVLLALWKKEIYLEREISLIPTQYTTNRVVVVNDRVRNRVDYFISSRFFSKTANFASVILKQKAYHVH